MEFIANVAQKYFLIFCYLTLLLVGLLDELDCISLFYIVYLFICLVIHILHDHGRRNVMKFWGILLIASGTCTFFTADAPRNHLNRSVCLSV
jgi:predicted membrane protein